MDQGAGEQWRRFTSFIRSTPEGWGQVVGSMGEMWEGFLGRMAEVWEQVSVSDISSSTHLSFNTLVLKHTCPSTDFFFNTVSECKMRFKLPCKKKISGINDN